MISDDLLKTIKDAVAAGQSKEVIYKILLDQGQLVDSINAHFKALIQETPRDETHIKTITLIVTIGVILIGAGVFSFIASNWKEMGQFLKIAIIVSAMTAAYFTGFHLKEKRRLAKTGEALYLLGAIIYGAGIFLIAQIFHVQANWPGGFILWMVGALVM